MAHWDNWANWANCSPRPSHRLAGPGHHRVAKVWNPSGSHHTGKESSTAPATGLRAQGGRDQEQLGDKKAESPRGRRSGAGERDCELAKETASQQKWLEASETNLWRDRCEDPSKTPGLGVSREDPSLENQQRPRSWEPTKTLGLGRKNLKAFSLTK